jgi:hypothetical protein
MSTIELSTDDVHDLTEVIDYRLAELTDEMAHTEDRAFRHSLRLATDRLEALRTRVHHLAADLPARPVPSPLASRSTVT